MVLANTVCNVCFSQGRKHRRDNNQAKFNYLLRQETLLLQKNKNFLQPIRRDQLSTNCYDTNGSSFCVFPVNTNASYGSIIVARRGQGRKIGKWRRKKLSFFLSPRSKKLGLKLRSKCFQATFKKTYRQSTYFVCP